MSLPRYNAEACELELRRLMARLEPQSEPGSGRGSGGGSGQGSGRGSGGGSGRGSEPAVLAQLLTFASLVCTWGQRTDLVAAKTTEALVDVLFLDAFVLSDALAPDSRLIDVGAGAGAPALPLAILRPDLFVTLLEPRRRRIAFMRTAIGTLGLADRAQLIESMLPEQDEIEELGDFDISMSRATFSPGEWLGRAAQISDRTLVLLAGAEPPTQDGWDVRWRMRYETYKGVPRQALRFDRIL